MTRDDIIRMAREAWGNSDPSVGSPAWVYTMERFAALVAKRAVSNIDSASWMSWQEGYAAGAAAEREACAKLCEHYDDDRGTGETWGPRFAALIRARGNT